jgi:mannose-6-phosphate isomerase-like protein (cupin superfamily)
VSFDTKILPATRDAVAPDGSDVRILLATTRGSLAHFELGPGETSVAVRHRTVEEIWYFLRGRGEMWRELEGQEQTVTVEPGVCITIPKGTAFQFRAAKDAEQLAAIGATMPPWPGAGEAVVVNGPWHPTLPPGPT